MTLCHYCLWHLLNDMLGSENNCPYTYMTFQHLLEAASEYGGSV